MTAEQIGLYEQAALTNEAAHVGAVVDFLHKLPEEDAWIMVRDGLDRAAMALHRRTPVVYLLVDDTAAGGAHAVRAIHDPETRQVVVEIPQESGQKGGRFPTVLHTLETIVNATRLAHGKKHGVTQDHGMVYPDGEVKYPAVTFMAGSSFGEKLRNSDRHERVFIPLTVNPPRTNALIFHPQARHIRPQEFAYAYYEMIQTDPDLDRDKLRHTMLYQAVDIADRRDKHEVALEVLLTSQAHGRFRVMNSGRISGNWEDSEAVKTLSLRRK